MFKQPQSQTFIKNPKQTTKKEILTVLQFSVQSHWQNFFFDLFLSKLEINLSAFYIHYLKVRVWEHSDSLHKLIPHRHIYTSLPNLTFLFSPKGVTLGSIFYVTCSRMVEHMAHPEPSLRGQRKETQELHVRLGIVAHNCNPSYSIGRDQKDRSPVWTKS